MKLPQESRTMKATEPNENWSEKAPSQLTVTKPEQGATQE